MPKIKKKRMGGAVASALKALEKMVFESGDLNVQLKQMKEKLSPALKLKYDVGSITWAGLNSSGLNQVLLNVPSGAYASPWPEWAYNVAVGALHFNQQVLVAYDTAPRGPNLYFVFCTNVPAQPGTVGGALGSRRSYPARAA
jgi:hypothetical protein